MVVMENLRKGIDVCAFLISQGYNVSHHFIDFKYVLNTAYPITVDQLRECSLDELIRSDVVICTFGWEGSTNCCREYELAKELHKPIYYDVMKFIEIDQEIPF